jgi:hypothetical protein
MAKGRLVHPSYMSILVNIPHPPGGNMCLISVEEKYEKGKEKKW